MKIYNLDSKIVTALSDKNDGSMKVPGEHGDVRLDNIRTFLKPLNIKIEQTIRVHVSYNTSNFKRYKIATKAMIGKGIVSPSPHMSDGLFTNQSDIALFLPFADCIGAVLYDPVTNTLGVSHLGRHNLLQYGGTHTILYMVEYFKCSPKNIKVMLTAAAGKDEYPLYSFENKSLHEVAISQLIDGSVERTNITIDGRNTVTDPMLFSHSASLKNSEIQKGRHAVFAMIR